MTWQDPQALQKFRAAEEVVRRQAGAKTLAVCRRCGMLPWNQEFTAWADLQAAAQQHADESGKGHLVVATLVRGDTFRPRNEEGDELLRLRSCTRT